MVLAYNKDVLITKMFCVIEASSFHVALANALELDLGPKVVKNVTIRWKFSDFYKNFHINFKALLYNRESVQSPLRMSDVFTCFTELIKGALFFQFRH